MEWFATTEFWVGVALGFVAACVLMVVGAAIGVWWAERLYSDDEDENWSVVG